MRASQLYDMIREQVSDKAFAGKLPSWHYSRTKLLIKIHLTEKIEVTTWRLR